MDYKEEFQRKLATVSDALALIQSGYYLGTACCGMESVAVFNELHTLAGKVSGLHLFNTATTHAYPFHSPEYLDLITMDNAYFMAPARKSYGHGGTSFLPCDLHTIAKRYLSCHPLDIYFGTVSEMDDNGYFYMGTSAVLERELIEAARYVVLEVNPNVPRVCGDTAIHVSAADMLIRSDAPMSVLPRADVTAVDKAIGAYAASLIQDGDTIQLGIGGIPEAICVSLRDKHDLGVHTEMINNGMMDLIQAGVITGRRKSLHPGKVVGAFALGEQALYDMMDRNPLFQIMRGDYVNNPFVVSQNRNMVSVNSALAVDLTGQCASESIGIRQYSGTGGQMDTAYGAIHAENGRSIIALPSTRKGGTVSSICSVLPAGSIVSLSRNVVDYVITEYGIAPLRGRTVRQRVENLIAVAHPDFREELYRQARDCLYI